MLEALILLITSSLLAIIYEKTTARSPLPGGGYKRAGKVIPKLAFISLLVNLALFAGLRTTMNDTASYISAFARHVPDTLSAILDVDWSLGANPLFAIYRIIIKSLISDNGSVLIMITAIIVVTSYLLFVKKYSEDFGFSIYLLLAFTVYAFVSAAIKQTFATAIAIWAIPLFVKGKKFRGILLILIAMLIHPYVLVLLTAMFLTKGIWNRKTVVILVVGIVCCISFSTFVSFVSDTAELLGDSYSEEVLSSGGMNIFRFLFYLIIPVLSFIFRKKITEDDDRLLFTYVNVSVVSAMFALMGCFGNANLFGRVANYFDIFLCLSLPMMLKRYLKNDWTGRLVKAAVIIGFAVFYYNYYNKYLNFAGGDWTKCFYDHISITEFFAGLKK